VATAMLRKLVNVRTTNIDPISPQRLLGMANHAASCELEPATGSSVTPPAGLLAGVAV